VSFDRLPASFRFPAMNFSPFSRLLSCWVAVLLACCNQSFVFAELPETVDFNFHIRPILSDRCYLCHGPDAENREADLRLDVEEGAFAALEGGEGSHVIKPGDPEQSELFLRVSTSDEDMRMPPADSHLTVSEEEIELLRKWIEQGAQWKPHWSFLPIEAAEVPETSGEAWPHNEIDRFVLARLKNEGLLPVAEASREKLIRRVTFDLTGLPPTLKEIDAFLSDQSPESYEKVEWRSNGSTWHGIPTPTAIKPMSTDRSGPGETGWSVPSTKICRTTSLSPGNLQETCCKTR